MAGNREKLEIKPNPAELARTRDFIRSRASECGLDDEARFRAALVATEAVTNAMRHGFAGDSADTPIEVACGCEGGCFVIEVGDRGTFRARATGASPPAESVGGRGLGLIERLTEQFDLETSGSGTRLRMLVGLGA